jgi:hypothetical protein
VLAAKIRPDRRLEQGHSWVSPLPYWTQTMPISTRPPLQTTGSIRPNHIESATTQPTVPTILVFWLSVFRPCFTALVWNHLLMLVSAPSWHLDSAPPHKHCASSGWRINPGSGHYLKRSTRARRDARDVARRLLPSIGRCCRPAAKW